MSHDLERLVLRSIPLRTWDLPIIQLRVLQLREPDTDIVFKPSSPFLSL